MDGLVLRVEDGAVLSEDLLDRVAAGDIVQITKGGQVIATVAGEKHDQPLKPNPEKVRAAFARIAANREKLRELGVTYSHDILRDIRDNLGSY